MNSSPGSDSAVRAEGKARASTHARLSAVPLSASAASAPSANLDQVRNGSASSPVSPGDWVNGDLTPTQAHYAEGYSVPWRVVMEDLPTGVPITITLGYDIRDSGKNALDYLTHYNRLEPHAPFGHAAEVIDPLAGLSGTFGAPSTYAIPAPNSVGSTVPGQPTNSFNALPAAERVMTLYNGTISNVSCVSEGSLTDAHSETQIAVTFTASDSTTVLAWGGQPVGWTGATVTQPAGLMVRLIICG